MKEEVANMASKNSHTYKDIFTVKEGKSNEIHFALRDDEKFIISRCQVLAGGERVYMRSSVTMSEESAIELAGKILGHFGSM